MSTASSVYPEIFVTGVVPQDANKLKLLADSLSAWGHTHMGHPLPEHFGTAMAEISFRLDVLGTPESFLAKSKEWQGAGMPLDFFENPIYQKPKSGKSKFQLLPIQIPYF